ncbi:24626_t:CDS:2, partial [Gigaspora rosea]
VKISQVRLYVKDEINSAVVWAVGNYPIEQETNSMMTISTSTCVSINKIPDSNNCPMRVSVVGIVQNEVETVPNDENAVVKSLLFVVGELEIIKDNICIYAKDINYVETHVEVKKQVITENSGNVPRPSTSANTINLNDFELDKSEINDYESEALKDYDTTNEYFDETRDSDMKDEEESSDDSFYTKNMRKEREV